MKCKDAVIKIVPSFYHEKTKKLKRKQAYKEIKLWVNYGKRLSISQIFLRRCFVP
jgi:alpha-beta hydrolase superfamily lysophospholipase